MTIGKKMDAETVRKFAMIGCTAEEIGRILGLAPDALERRFGPLIEQARAEGRAELRRSQWDKAQDGNVPMLIWLGKYLLGQADPAKGAAGDADPAARAFKVVLDFSKEPGTESAK